jgi:glycogen debranching enzyme
MRRIVKVALFAFPILLGTCLAVNAQAKEKEKHIKIVISDKSGKITELDTLITGEPKSDSIKLKNGETFYLARHGSFDKSGIKGKPETMVVSFSSDNNAPHDLTKKIIIVSDSAKVIDDGDVIIVNGDKISNDKNGRYIVTTSKAGNANGAGYVYVTSSNDSGDKKEKTIEVRVTSDDKEKAVEMTRYVIAKDGMVVTVEGNDEAKAKEIIEEVKAKLGEDTKSKEVTKAKVKK